MITQNWRNYAKYHLKLFRSSCSFVFIRQKKYSKSSNQSYFDQEDIMNRIVPVIILVLTMFVPAFDSINFRDLVPHYASDPFKPVWDKINSIGKDVMQNAADFMYHSKRADCMHHCHGVCNARTNFECIDCARTANCPGHSSGETCSANNECSCSAANDDCVFYSLVDDVFNKICDGSKCINCKVDQDCIDEYLADPAKSKCVNGFCGQ